MDDDANETEGMGAVFWLMLILGIIGVIGLFAVAGGAMGGAL